MPALSTLWDAAKDFNQNNLPVIATDWANRQLSLGLERQPRGRPATPVPRIDAIPEEGARAIFAPAKPPDPSPRKQRERRRIAHLTWPRCSAALAGAAEYPLRVMYMVAIPKMRSRRSDAVHRYPEALPSGLRTQATVSTTGMSNIPFLRWS